MTKLEKKSPISRRSPKRNRLLAKLSESLYAKVLPELEIISLPRDCNIYQHTKKIDFVYFPISSIVAIVSVLENGASPEVAAIGNDGLVGADLFMRSSSITNKVIVQSAGFAYRIKAALAEKLFDSDDEFRRLVLQYIRTLFTQTSQIAVCNRFHNIDQQVCRFLLTSLDRWGTNRISLTHQRIADLLGVRRAGVSEVSARLAKAGYIQYHRGCVTVLDREALEQQVCECYQVIKKEIDTLLK